MSPTRLLWTGPYSADLRGRAIERVGAEALWVVPTPLARDQVVAELTRRGSGPYAPSVFCWDQLWTEVARRHPGPPALLSDASARAILVASIDRARERDQLGPLSVVADLPGTRKALRSRIAAWTRSDRKLNEPPPRDDAVTRAEWAIFRLYRQLLAEHRAVDATGLAIWAANSLQADSLGRRKSVVFLDPVAPNLAQLNMIRWAVRRSLDVIVTLPTSGDISGDDPAISPLRSELMEAGFEDEAFEADDSNPRGTLETSLFSGESPFDQIGYVEGLSFVSGPQGEGLGLLLAREVRQCLESGIPPDEVLVLVRHVDDDAARAMEIMHSWGIPAYGSDRRPLGTEPAVAALRLAMSIPVGGWEGIPLIRLLRNGQIAAPDPSSRAEAASVIQSLRVFRGRSHIEAALDRASLPEGLDRLRATRARAVLDRIAKAIDPPSEETTWLGHAASLQRMAAKLGLGASARDHDALDAVWEALDDHSLIREFSGRPLDRDGFAREVEAILLDLDAPPQIAGPGIVRFATVDEVAGTRARAILLMNLAEGTFPTREAVVPQDGDDEGGIEGESLAFARERLQFLHALGSASDQVVLLSPTTDEKGQDLLPAGFLDDVRRLVDTSKTRTLARLDPSFREHPELAQAPADARVLALARACLDRQSASLRDLLGDPLHRGSLEGTAASLRLIHDRLRSREFTEFDGLLKDRSLIARIAEQFGPDHSFSASQFESFALCPFQFFQRYVLKIAPVDDGPELRDDRAAQGQRLHATLEEIHTSIQSEGANVDDLGRVEVHIQSRMSVDLQVDDVDAGEVAGGLRAIDDELLRRRLKKYASEFSTYRGTLGLDARPYRFELRFGGGEIDGVPALELGDGAGQVRFRGSIDRVDLIETATGPAFRVIDYKSGKPPEGVEVTKHLKLVQLPLYALAVERHFFGDSASTCDFGYWGVGQDGFKVVGLQKGDDWPAFRERVVEEVLRLASMLREGQFAVNPTKVDCTNSCDYKVVCRIGQIRNLEKELVTISAFP